MRKLILILMVTMLLCSGCTVVSELLLSSTENTETETLKISEQNSEIIDSLIDIMQLDKTKNSVAGFTSESTFEDVLNEIDNGKISTVFLTYYSELVGYPTIVTYVFKNIEDDNGNIDIGNPPLVLMVFDVLLDEESTSGEQLKEIIESMDNFLGEHTTDEESENYYWEKDDFNCRFLTDTDFVSTGAIARIYAIATSEMDLSVLFPSSFGTDIYTVYCNEKSSPLPEGFTEDMYAYYYTDYSYHLIYYDGETSVCLFFTAEDSELKLSGASLQTDLQSAGIEELDDILESFADRMEDILGSADSRRITYCYNQPSLSMEWPGLVIRAYEYGSDETYSIFIDFSEDYIKNQ